MPIAPLARAVTLVFAAAALAGCASTLPGRIEAGPSLKTVPAIAPSVTAAVRQDLAIERWWRLLGDPALERLMDEALAHNEDLEQAFARVREAQASLEQARAAQSPTLDLNARASRSQQSEVGATPLPPGVGRRASSDRVTLDAGYELDLWGKLASGSEAARQQLLSTEWARQTLEWSLTARLADAYFGLAAVDRQIEISESVRALREQTLRARQHEQAAGAGNEFDLRRAEAELTGTQATLAGLGRQRAALERALTALLGRTPAEIASGTLRRNRIDERKALDTVLPQGGAADLLVRRPDIRQAEAQLAAANANIEAARAATLPAVRLSGSLGSDAKSIASLFSGPSLIWTIAASFAQPILDGGRTRSRVAEERARAEQSLANYRKVVAGAILDVRETYAVLDLAHEALRAERERVASLARARELAKLGYDNGALSYLDLLDAERNWHQAQLQQVDAFRDQITSQVAAFKALGGGYAPANPEPNSKEN